MEKTHPAGLQPDRRGRADVGRDRAVGYAFQVEDLIELQPRNEGSLVEVWAGTLTPMNRFGEVALFA